MSTPGGEMICWLTVEQLSTSGEIQKRSSHKNIELSLIRNEFRDILLKILLPGKKDLRFNMRDHVLHKRFAKDGKATIKLPKQRVQFMLSNCPSDKLIMFLKILSTKMTCQEMKGFVPDRKRLLSEMPRSAEDISPLNMKELETVHKLRAEKAEGKPNLFTPKRKGMGALKRKREPGCDKENALQAKSARTNSTDSSVPRPVIAPVILSKEQKRVLEKVLSGSNIFFTGSAGTGKSFLLRRIIGALPPQHTFATASTGVAACHIGGTTLHAFAGIGSGKAPLEQCIELASRAQVAQQWRKCKHLIIDEISMIDGDFFDKLEIVARVIKKSDRPFGGIQLILCGDFLQLPPVTKGNEKRKFAFQAKSWRECMHLNMELHEVRRQKDQTFINILQNIRVGKCPDAICKVLEKTSKHRIEHEGVLATRLCTHKEDVQQINDYHLRKLQTQEREYESTDSDPAMTKYIDAQCIVPQKLKVKEGAQVMLAKNLNVEAGLVNGARGVILGFEAGSYGYPIVQFACGQKVTIRPERWTLKLAGGLILTRKQLPLMLAWAISIHKSQGMSLDCVEMSLSKVFECGQAYVALSRARSLEGLRVLDFDRNCVKANSSVLRFYNGMRLADCMEQQTLEACMDEPVPDHW